MEIYKIMLAWPAGPGFVRLTGFSTLITTYSISISEMNDTDQINMCLEMKFLHVYIMVRKICNDICHIVSLSVLILLYAEEIHAKGTTL